jgi:hypothetical protein
MTDAENEKANERHAITWLAIVFGGGLAVVAALVTLLVCAIVKAR